MLLSIRVGRWFPSYDSRCAAENLQISKRWRAFSPVCLRPIDSDWWSSSCRTLHDSPSRSVSGENRAPRPGNARSCYGRCFRPNVADSSVIDMIDHRDESLCLEILTLTFSFENRQHNVHRNLSAECRLFYMLHDKGLGRDLFVDAEGSFVTDVEFRPWTERLDQYQFSDVVGGVGSMLVVSLLVSLLILDDVSLGLFRHRR